MDLKEVEKTISILERADTNWKNCEKLAILYAIKNQNNNSEEKELFSFKEALATDSEFTRIAKSTSKEKLINVLDEHFEGIKILYPKEYALVLKKLLE